MAFLHSSHPLGRLRNENDIIGEIDVTADQISELAGSVKEWLSAAHDAPQRLDRATVLLGLVADLADGIHGHTEALTRLVCAQKAAAA